MKQFLSRFSAFLGAAAALFVVAVLVPQARAVTVAPTELNFLRQLNGTPVWLGVLASAAGSSISNSATSVPFAVVAGEPLLFQCDVTSQITVSGSTASRTITASTYGPKVETPQLFYAVPKGTAISMIPTAVVAGNCVVWKMVYP